MSTAAAVPLTAGELSAAELLSAAGRADLRIRLAEAERLLLAVLWADANPVTEANPLPARLQTRGEDLPAHPGLAGVTASAVAELAAEFAMTTHSGTALIADGLELRHRLPRVWDLLLVGGFQVWRARQLAQATVKLNDEAVAWIDIQAAIAGLGLGPKQLERLVLQAMHQHDPDQLPAAEDTPWVRIGHDQQATSGMANLDGRLSSLDAADLDEALALEAAAIAADGDTSPLPVRRATALGNLARNALAQPVLPDDDEAESQAAAPVGSRVARPVRQFRFYAHLAAATLGIGAGCQHCATTQLVEVPDWGTLVDPEVIRAWCGSADVRVTVTPVIDTATIHHVNGDHPASQQRAHTAVRDGTCVFPFCRRPAHPIPRRAVDVDRSDLDHIQPRSQDGATSTDNLGSLCRRHHRLKTFTAWRYQMLSLDGVYLWTSPVGVRYLRTRTTTINLDDVSPPPVGPDSKPDEEFDTQVGSTGQSAAYLSAVEHARTRISAHQYHRTASNSGPPDEPPDDPPPF